MYEERRRRRDTMGRCTRVSVAHDSHADDNGVQVRQQHYNYIGVLSDGDRKPTAAELAIVLDSLLASHALLMEDGSRKMDGDRRLVLNFEQAEVERVLGECGGWPWQNALSMS
jgi:origin recognition complex subunit 1